jgi:hypothetical protein
LSFENSSDSFSSFITFIIYPLTLALPVFMWIVLWTKMSKLEEPYYEKWYGEFYSGLNIKSKAALLFNVIQLFRRLLLTSITSSSNDAWSAIQVQLYIFHSMLIVIYIFATKPFTSPFDNKLECFNEICIMFSSVHMIMFTDLVPDLELQFKIGYSIISVIFINMAVNMYLMIKDQI